MVGGGSRRDDGSMVINNTNVFAALETLRKKKKSDKDRKSGSKAHSSKAHSASAQADPKEPERQVFWTPAPLTVKSWADVDDEDDEDYYATAAPPQTSWGAAEEDQQQSKGQDSHLEVGAFYLLLLLYLYELVIVALCLFVFLCLQNLILLPDDDDMDPSRQCLNILLFVCCFFINVVRMLRGLVAVLCTLVKSRINLKNLFCIAYSELCLKLHT